MTVAVTPVGGDLALAPVGGAVATSFRACRRVSPPQVKRLRTRMAARTGVESVRCRPRAFSRPRSCKRVRSVQTARLGLAGDESGAKLAQHGGITAGVRARERQGLLPINAASDMLCRLAIREPFETWHDGDEGQPGRIEGGLP